MSKIEATNLENKITKRRGVSENLIFFIRTYFKLKK